MADRLLFIAFSHTLVALAAVHSTGDAQKRLLLLMLSDPTDEMQLLGCNLVKLAAGTEAIS